MGYEIESLTTCDNCARLFDGSIRRHYCEHCDRYYFICPSCAARGAHCRYCGIPLKNSSERRTVRS
jgi:hypothetical protein